jgi:hypothetical protein
MLLIISTELFTVHCHACNSICDDLNWLPAAAITNRTKGINANSWPITAPSTSQPALQIFTPQK